MNFEKSGIISENPYRDANNSVCFELLQLLIVVEKIKTSKEGLKALDSLVSLHSFLRKQECIQGFFSRHHDFSGTGTTEADCIFSTVCTVLDGKRLPTFNDFSIEASVYLKQDQKFAHGSKAKSNHERTVDFWLKIAPELINKHGYDFCSLQQWALGYSHLSITYAYIEAEKILDVIDALQNRNDDSIVETTIQNYANEMKLERSSVFSKSEHSIHIRYQVNQKICTAFSQHFFEHVNKVKVLLAINVRPYDRYYPKVEIKAEEYKHLYSALEDCDVVTMKLPQEVFKLAKDSGTEILLNRAILNCIWERVEKSQNFINNLDESYYLNNLSEYSYWASNQNDTLVSIELSKGRKLSIHTMLRGLRFSYWFYSEKRKEQEKLKISDAVKLFVKEKKVQDSAMTTKFSFEAVKRVGKDELAPLICKQLMWRLKNDIPSVIYCFSPLNDEFYQKLKETISRIEAIFGSQTCIENYSDILDYIIKINDNLKNNDNSEFLDTQLELSHLSKTVPDNMMNKNNLIKAIEYKEALLALNS